MDKKDRDQKVFEYCIAQGIPVGPPNPEGSDYVYSIKLDDLNGIQFTTINNILNGKEVNTDIRY